LDQDGGAFAGFGFAGEEGDIAVGMLAVDEAGGGAGPGAQPSSIPGMNAL